MIVSTPSGGLGIRDTNAANNGHRGAPEGVALVGAVSRCGHGLVTSRPPFIHYSASQFPSARPFSFSRFRSPSVLPPSKPPPVTFLRTVMSSTSQVTTVTTSHDSQRSIREEDWDRSESDVQMVGGPKTPRNSVLFPADGMPDASPRKGGRRENRTLSELLKLYAEKGTDCQLSQEEATRIADVLGQWVCLSLISTLLFIRSAEN